jgi:hypothetical protein
VRPGEVARLHDEGKVVDALELLFALDRILSASIVGEVPE